MTEPSAPKKFEYNSTQMLGPMIFTIVIVVFLWAAFIFNAVNGSLYLPIWPVLTTVVLAYGLLRYRKAKQREEGTGA